MSISGIFGKNNLSRIVVEARFPDEIYAGKPIPLRITVRNMRKNMPAFLIRVQTGNSSVFFPFVDSDSKATKYINMTFDRRGAYELADIILSSVFPFSFFIRYKHLRQRFPYIVFPELKRHELSTNDENARKKHGDNTSDKIGYESDVISIRQYVHGDPLKYINWKATAKTGELKTKELSTLFCEPVVIDFDKVAIRDVEERISSVAYRILQLLRKERPVGLRIGSKLYKPGASHDHKIGMLKELALYGNDS